MAKARHSERITNHTMTIIVLEEFLLANGFVAIGATDTHFSYTKGDVSIQLPKGQFIGKNDALTILETAGLTLEAFRAFEADSPFRQFEKLIDLSLKTPPIKKNKDVE